MECSLNIAAYVRVFAKAGNSLIVQPGTNAHLKICCWSYLLKLNIEHWTSSPNRCWCLHLADVTLSSPAFANTFVCVQQSCLCDESRSLDGRSGATFTIKPVACCVPISWEVVNDAAGASVRAERIVKRLWGLDNCYRCKKKRCTTCPDFSGWLFQFKFTFVTSCQKC